VERLHATPFVVHIVKATPTRSDHIAVTLKEQGFSPRQRHNC
jgi:hypothetical protein